MTRAWHRLEWLAAAGLAVVFIYSGVQKIAEPMVFAYAISNYRLLPEQLVNFAAVLLPWFELLSGTAVLLPGWRKSGALLIGAMCLLFIIAQASALGRGLDIACGCFGNGNARVGFYTLGLDVLLAATGCFLCSRET